MDKTKSKTVPVTKMMVWQAYKQVRANKGGSGADNVSLKDFEADIKNNLYKLWNRLASGSYFPPPVKRVEIPKKGGKTRILGIPTVSDRIAQMVFKNYLEPRFEAIFDKDSYGYRPGKSAHDALKKTREMCWKNSWVIDLDIQGFFDNINHDLLMKALTVHVSERWVQLYVKRWLEVSITDTKGNVTKRTKGTPQGGVISPLLANVYLHYAFDKWMRNEFASLSFERYADDIVVHCKTHNQAQYVLSQISIRLKECKLSLHPDKTKIVYCQNDANTNDYPEKQFTFLGYTFRPRSTRGFDGILRTGFDLGISKEALLKINSEIRRIKIHRLVSMDLKSMAKLLNPKLRGWLNYYGKFRKSLLGGFLYNLEQRLILWLRNRYKRFKRSKKKAWNWWTKLKKHYPKLFYHWKYV